MLVPPLVKSPDHGLSGSLASACHILHASWTVRINCAWTYAWFGGAAVRDLRFEATPELQAVMAEGPAGRRVSTRSGRWYGCTTVENHAVACSKTPASTPRDRSLYCPLQPEAPRAAGRVLGAGTGDRVKRTRARRQTCSRLRSRGQAWRGGGRDWWAASQHMFPAGRDRRDDCSGFTLAKQARSRPLRPKGTVVWREGIGKLHWRCTMVDTYVPIRDNT